MKGGIKLKNRIELIRQNLGYSQDKFGEILGVTRSSVCAWEAGRRNISDSIIKSICREFDINEEWLRTGNGEMKLISSEDDEVMKYVGLLLKDREDFVAQKIKRFIIGYEKLDAEDRKVVEKLMRQVFEDEKKEQD